MKKQEILQAVKEIDHPQMFLKERVKSLDYEE